MVFGRQVPRPRKDLVRPLFLGDRRKRRITGDPIWPVLTTATPSRLTVEPVDQPVRLASELEYATRARHGAHLPGNSRTWPAAVRTSAADHGGFLRNFSDAEGAIAPALRSSVSASSRVSGDRQQCVAEECATYTVSACSCLHPPVCPRGYAPKRTRRGPKSRDRNKNICCTQDGATH